MPEEIDKVNIWFGAKGTETIEASFAVKPGSTFKRGDLVMIVDRLVCDIPLGPKGEALCPDRYQGLAMAVRDAEVEGRVASTENLCWVLPVCAKTDPTMVGARMPLVRLAPAKWCLDPSVEREGHICVEITTTHPQYAVGEEFGWVVVRFAPGPEPERRRSQPKSAPVQSSGPYRDTQGSMSDPLSGFRVPFAVHALAAEEYNRHHVQSAEKLADRGGLSWVELIAGLRGDMTYEGLAKATCDLERMIAQEGYKVAE